MKRKYFIVFIVTLLLLSILNSCEVVEEGRILSTLPETSEVIVRSSDISDYMGQYITGKEAQFILDNINYFIENSKYRLLDYCEVNIAQGSTTLSYKIEQEEEYIKSIISQIEEWNVFYLSLYRPNSDNKVSKIKLTEDTISYEKKYDKEYHPIQSKSYVSGDFVEYTIGRAFYRHAINMENITVNLTTLVGHHYSYDKDNIYDRYKNSIIDKKLGYAVETIFNEDGVLTTINFIETGKTLSTLNSVKLSDIITKLIQEKDVLILILLLIGLFSLLGVGNSIKKRKKAKEELINKFKETIHEIDSYSRTETESKYKFFSKLETILGYKQFDYKKLRDKVQQLYNKLKETERIISDNTLIHKRFMLFCDVHVNSYIETISKYVATPYSFNNIADNLCTLTDKFIIALESFVDSVKLDTSFDLETDIESMENMLDLNAQN